jgi:GH25 family lysozyme M1 (1,4-beta-N-acetylmuramidase)
MALFGVDISTWQPHTDWARIATAVQFAVVKCGGGTWYTNPLYGAQVAGARAAGLTVGHYHYAFEGRRASAEDEARSFLDRADIRPGEFVALDVEDGDGDLAGWVLAWLQAVQDTLRIAPLLYSYPSFFDAHGLHDERLREFPVWYAWYPDSGATDRWPSVAPWGRPTIWQYTANGDVPGIDRVVDLNVFDGDWGALRALGLGGLGRIEPDANRLRAWFEAHRRVA